MMDAILHNDLSVYLADDDEDDRFLFEEALMQVKKNVKITMLNNGEQLLKILDQKKSNYPNLIFLDLNMPLKNGFECLDEIKKDNNLKDIPVIIFSTSNQKETINQVYIKGATYYMCKPDNFVKLKLIPKVLTGTVDAATGGTVTLTDNSHVTLLANSVVVKSTGAAYTGTIKVYAAK